MPRKLSSILFCGFVALSLIGAGCTGSAETTTESELPTASPPTLAPTLPPTTIPSPTIQPTREETPVPEILETCIIGRWIVADAAPYFQTAYEGTDIIYNGTSGNAWYQFNLDGTVLFEAVQFTQSSTIKSGSVEVPVEVTIDGPGFADYRIEEIGKIIFSNTQSSSIFMEVEVFGEREVLDTIGLLGDPAADQSVFLYECQGENRLLLTPPLKNYEVFPLILERYP
ncbi:MAG: hypothetical protein N2646_06545 [Bellilinea sp.]|nr:hypothetical protein [Bellilinea sp.]